MDADLAPVVDDVPGDDSLRPPGLGDVVAAEPGQVSGSVGCWLCTHFSIYLQVIINFLIKYASRRIYQV